MIHAITGKDLLFIYKDSWGPVWIWILIKWYLKVAVITFWVHIIKKECMLLQRPMYILTLRKGWLLCYWWKRPTNVFVLTQLHVAHDNIFRLLFRLPTRCTKYSFPFINIPSFIVNMRKLVYSLYRHTRNCENQLIQTIVQSKFLRVLRYLRSGSQYCFKVFLLRCSAFQPITI